MAQCKRSICTEGEIDYRNYDHEAVAARTEIARGNLRDQFRARNSGELVGEIVRFPWADGYAEYMIEKERPFLLVHLADCDAWQVPYSQIRGYRLADARDDVERERRRAQLYAERAAERAAAGD